MRRAISITLAFSLALGVGFTSGGAGADSRCDSPLVVFSRSSANLVASLNWNGAACLPSIALPEAAAVADGPLDFRIINPGSDFITIRYTEDVRFKPGYVHAKLNGLGFDNYRILLPRVDISLTEEPDWTYERELGIDPNASGCLKVVAWYTHKKKTRNGVKKIKVLREKTWYHTLEASC